MKKLVASVLGGFGFLLLLSGSAVAQGGELVAAEFGYEGHRADVTQQVRSYMHDGILRFQVTKEALGVDPARGHVKELYIRIRHWDGNVEEFHFPEYANINLALDPDRGYEWHDRELHIMRAFYGGAGHFVDVTEQLRSYKHDGQLFVVVDNRNMGGDPDPSIHKVLRVLYFAAGERHQIVVPEHGELRLP
jgi:hypothetical protein